METQSDKQENNKGKTPLSQVGDSKPWLWKKGQSGNPNGRPKGKTLKDWARDYLACMTDAERENFLDGLPKEVIWKMAEGNPSEEKKLNVEANVSTSTLTQEQIDAINKIAFNDDYGQPQTQTP